MSSDLRGPALGNAESGGTPAAVAAGDARRGVTRSRLGLVVRVLAHLGAWTPFVYGLARALGGGWRPVSDSAVIAIRAWDTLTAQGLLVGEVTRLAHGVYDLGPLEFWLLSLPVHLDPAHGVLWGGALWCIVAASLTIEAAWAVARELGAAIASAVILGIVAWSPQLAMLPDWNPWFGMMFFLAALAAGLAVLTGRTRWWPVLVVTGSVAAQTHLMYAFAAAGLLATGFIVVLVDSWRSRSYRWAVIGIVAGLACWAAPLIQQFTARTGNITSLIDALRAGGTAHAGLSYGLKALSASAMPPVYWWKPSLETLKLSSVEHESALPGAVELGLMVVLLAVAVFVLRSRGAAALAGLSLVTSAASLETFSGIPSSEIFRPVTNLSYLLAPMFAIGVLAWLATGSVLVLALWPAARQLAVHPGSRRRASGAASTWPATGASWGRTIGGVALVALVAVLTVTAAAPIGGALSSQSAGRQDVTSSAARVERAISARPVALKVVARGNILGRQVATGLAYALRTKGYAPEIAPRWGFQIAPAYSYHGAPIAHVTVFVRHGGRIRVVVTRR